MIVRLPAGRRLEDVAKLAESAGIRPDHVDNVLKALRNGPAVKIGAAVNRARADKARDQFTKAGLSVDVTPLLSLSAVTTGAFVNPGLPERAGLLRAMASLSGGMTDGPMAAAIEAVTTAALGKTGYERARTMTLLALAYADSGMRARAGEYTQLALSTPNLSGAEATELHADLLLRGDMVNAKAMHNAGLYADAEATLQRLGSLLL